MSWIQIRPSAFRLIPRTACSSQHPIRSLSVFPHGHALTNWSGEKHNWPRPMIFVDGDSLDASVEERLEQFLLLSRAASIPMRVITMRDEFLRNLMPRPSLIAQHDHKTYSVLSLPSSGNIVFYNSTRSVDAEIKRQIRMLVDETRSITGPFLIISNTEFPVLGTQRHAPYTVIRSASDELPLFWKHALDGKGTLSSIKAGNNGLSPAAMQLMNTTNGMGRLMHLSIQKTIKDLEMTERKYTGRSFRKGEFCFECRVLLNSGTVLRSLGYGWQVKHARREATFAMLAQLAYFNDQRAFLKLW